MIGAVRPCCRETYPTPRAHARNLTAAARGLLDVNGPLRATDRLFFTAISWQVGATLGATPGGQNISSWGAESLILRGFLDAILTWPRGRIRTRDTVAGILVHRATILL